MPGFDADAQDLTVGVIGAGAMGRGIAQVLAACGCRVLLADARAGAADEGAAFARRMLDRAAEKGAMTGEAAAVAKARIAVVPPDSPRFAEARLAIEAIVEDLEPKRRLFAALESVVDEGCVLATNTSSLSVTAIAAACRRPARVAGFHFFNPVPLMKLVEVIGGPLTDPAAVESLLALGRRIGHRAVVVADSPGFLVNHAGRGFGTEALRIVGEGVADFAAVDRILRDAAGFRMGPFELMDLTGVDVSHPVMESIYEQFYHEPRFRPSPIARQRMAAGLLGRKTGRGYYPYKDGHMQAPPEPAVPAPRGSRPLWVSPRDAAGHAAVAAALGGRAETGAKPPADAVCIVTPVGEDATTAALAEGLDPRRTVAVDPMFAAGRRTLMTTPVTEAGARDAAHAALAADGTPVTVIRDSAGFVAQRVVACVVNVACDIAQQRIARPEDIDSAVTLGLGYPAGPLAWGDKLGPARVLAVLDAMQRLYGDPRYRASPWLRRRALLGVSLLTPED